MSATVILICGKIGSGKSRYASKLKHERNAVVFSCDELTTALFPEGLGGHHDTMTTKIKTYLYRKAAEAVNAGCSAILEFGFWSRTERTRVSELYTDLGIPFEWHYVDISDEDWRDNIRTRNILIKDGASQDYEVDAGLLNKLMLMFEEPSPDEMAVWYGNRRSYEDHCNRGSDH